MKAGYNILTLNRILPTWIAWRGEGVWALAEEMWIKEGSDVRWNLRQVIGYWLWWRNHRLVAGEKGRPAMDFPEFLQWVRLDFQGKRSEV